MERRGFVRPIQSGEEGAGFKIPCEILQVEPEISINVSREIMTVASRNISTRKERSAVAELENEEVIHTISDDEMQFWKTELQKRLFLLHHRK